MSVVWNNGVYGESCKPGTMPHVETRLPERIPEVNYPRLDSFAERRKSNSTLSPEMSISATSLIALKFAKLWCSVCLYIRRGCFGASTQTRMQIARLGEYVFFFHRVVIPVIQHEVRLFLSGGLSALLNINGGKSFRQPDYCVQLSTTPRLYVSPRCRDNRTNHTSSILFSLHPPSSLSLF